jgi:uncharacterized protein
MLTFIVKFIVMTTEQQEHTSWINKTAEFVKKSLQDAESGHDWNHVFRVWSNAKKIAEGEQCDLTVVELGALLHDIADSKFHNGDEEKGPTLAQAFLKELKVPETLINEVVTIIRKISFKGGNFKQENLSIELQIVQDADRLDAMGAIGIARAFHFGGHRNRPLFDPEVEPKLNMEPEEYKKRLSPTLNHFYEKLLLLNDRFHTTTAKQLAEQRHQFMLQYLEQFYEEWGLVPDWHKSK